MPQKRPRGGEEDDPDYDPRADAEVQGPPVEPQEDPNEDVKQNRLTVAHIKTMFECTL